MTFGPLSLILNPFTTLILHCACACFSYSRARSLPLTSFANPLASARCLFPIHAVRNSVMPRPLCLTACCWTVRGSAAPAVPHHGSPAHQRDVLVLNTRHLDLRSTTTNDSLVPSPRHALAPSPRSLAVTTARELERTTASATQPAIRQAKHKRPEGQYRISC